MEKIKYLSFLFIIFLCLSAKAQEGSAEDYFKKALMKDAQLKSLKYEKEAAEKRAAYAGALPDPSVMGTAFIKPVETRVGPQRASIALSQPLPFPGKLNARKAVASQAISVKEAMIHARENELRKEVYLTYLDMYFLNYRIKLLRETIEWYQQLKEISEVKIEAGSGSSLDLLQVEIQILKYQRDLENLRDDKSILHEQWKNTMNDQNVSFPENFIIPSDSLPKNYAKMVTAATDSNARVLVYEELIKQRELEVLQAKKEGLPDFTLGASYINIGQRTDMVVEGNGSDAWLFPQIGIKIPLFQQKYRDQVSEKQLLAASVRATQEDFKNDASAELGKYLAVYSKQNRNHEIDLKLIELTEQALELMLSEYSSGLRRFEDLLLLESQLLTFRLSAEESLVNQQKTIAIIDFISGSHKK